MRPLIINKTTTTPKVTLDKAEGIFKFEGVSRPEDVLKFYNPVFEWIQEYLQDPNQKTVVEFQLIYHNTASAKIIVKLINLFKMLAAANKEVEVKWYYRENDEDIKESGEDYKSLIDIPVELIEIA